MTQNSQHSLGRTVGAAPGFALGIAATLAAQFAGGSAKWPTFIPLTFDFSQISAWHAAQWPLIFGLLTLAAVSVAVAGRALLARRVAPTSTSPIHTKPARIGAPSSAGIQSPLSNQSDLDAARVDIDRQLAALVGFVSRYLDATADQAVKISQAQSRLEQATTIEQVQVVIRLLVASNAQARRDAEDLKVRLIESKNHAAKVQSNLAKAMTLASLDALTNLPNRRRLEEHLDEQISLSHRDKTPLCLVMADIDYFKSINDKFGHPSGDAVLKQFADILAKNLRNTDFSARYGGEEFVVVLPRTPLGNASHVIEGLRSKLSEAKWCGVPATRTVGKVTASFGIAEIRDNETLEQFIDRADQKLYEAKQNGRDRIEIDHNI